MERYLHQMILENAELRKQNELSTMAQQARMMLPASPPIQSSSDPIHVAQHNVNAAPSSAAPSSLGQFGSLSHGAYPHSNAPGFEDIDVNHDGVITKEEFSQGFAGYHTLATRQAQQATLTSDKGYNVAYSRVLPGEGDAYRFSHPAGVSSVKTPTLQMGSPPLHNGQ